MGFFRDTDLTVEHSKATRKLPVRDVLGGDMLGTVSSGTMYQDYFNICVHRP